MKQYLENNPTIVKNEHIIYHFPGEPGNFSSKWIKMIAFWDKIKINSQIKKILNIIRVKNNII